MVAENMTKGAQRRSAYVSLGIDMPFILSTFYWHPHSWVWSVVLVIAVIDLVNSLHKLAMIGFTSRADNEQ